MKKKKPADYKTPKVKISAVRVECSLLTQSTGEAFKEQTEYDDNPENWTWQ